eukprot:766677-Hanusia_phi.AAC.9
MASSQQDLESFSRRDHYHGQDNWHHSSPSHAMPTLGQTSMTEVRQVTYQERLDNSEPSGYHKQVSQPVST